MFHFHLFMGKKNKQETLLGRRSVEVWTSSPSEPYNMNYSILSIVSNKFIELGHKKELFVYLLQRTGSFARGMSRLRGASN